MKTKLNISAFAILLIAFIIISCQKNEISVNKKNYSVTPILPATTDNYAASGNDDVATLGRVLFYDKNLSLNNSVSCASCHQQEKAFCDNQQFSTGLEGAKTPRNAPSIFAKTSRMFWDGRASSLESLVLRPIQNHVEMKFENLQALANKVSKISYYPALFQKAFNTNVIDSSMVQAALKEFLRNFNFSNSKFNKSQAGTEALTASETLGKQIFFGRGQCSSCHHIENTGATPTNSMGGGYGFTDESHNIGLDLVYADNGIGSITKRKEDEGLFMIPVLLNVEYTSPYMHDGRYKTLEEVVEHYNSGIQNHPNLDVNLRDLSSLGKLSNQDVLKLLDLNHDGEIENEELAGLPPIKLGLTPSEKKGVVDFLKTLSDPTILTEAKFSNPFLMK